MLKNFVINVETNQERRDYIMMQFSQHDVDFTFFKAVTPSDNAHIKSNLNLTGIASSCSELEMSCLLSHVSLWQKCVDADMDYIGIFEDDICLGENAARLLNHDDWLKTSKADTIKLEKSGKRVKLGNMSQPIFDSHRVLRPLLSRNIGAAGYILSKTGAAYLLKFIQSQSHLEAIDIILFDDSKYPKALPVNLMLPCLVIQQSELYHSGQADNLLTSQLDANRGEEIKIKATPWQRIKKEVDRNLRQFYMVETKFN